jgi:NDP-sugar pyrophosphorylase family protein
MLPVIILAGGLGSRLGFLTKNLPKVLLPINKKPFLQWQLELLERNGITHVTLCLGHLSDKVVDFVENDYKGAISVDYCFDGRHGLGTGGAVKQASAGIATPFFILYGDSYLNIDYERVSSSYLERHGPLMTIIENKNTLDKSNVFKENGQFFYQKHEPPKSARFIDYGLGIFEAKHFNEFSGIFDLSIVQSHFSKKSSMQFFKANRRFYEVGSLLGVSDLEAYLKVD